MKCKVKSPEICQLKAYKKGLCNVHYEAYQAVEKTKGTNKISQTIPLSEIVPPFEWLVSECFINSASTIQFKDNPNSRYYEPLKNEELHIRLAEVNLNDNKSILAFVNKYGILGLSLESRLGFVTKNDVVVQPIKLMPPNESLEYFKQEALNVKQLVNIIKDGQIDNDIEVKYDFLNSVVNKLRAYGVYPSAIIDSKGKVTHSYGAVNLIGAIYLQLYLMVTKRLNYKECEDKSCSNLFILTRKNKQFCSDNCSARARMRDKYNRQKAKEGK